VEVVVDLLTDQPNPSAQPTNNLTVVYPLQSLFGGGNKKENICISR